MRQGQGGKKAFDCEVEASIAKLKLTLKQGGRSSRLGKPVVLSSLP